MIKQRTERWPLDFTRPIAIHSAILVAYLVIVISYETNLAIIHYSARAH